jgi:hypothetical protein
MAIVCAAYAAQRINSLRNGMLNNCAFGTYRAATTKKQNKRTHPTTAGSYRSGLPQKKSPVVYTCGVSVFGVFRRIKAVLGGL